MNIEITQEVLITNNPISKQSVQEKFPGAKIE
jgi:hypothetical protein